MKLLAFVPVLTHSTMHLQAFSWAHCIVMLSFTLLGLSKVLPLQTTSVSALNLHVITVLCYGWVEVYAWMEFGRGACLGRGPGHALLMLTLCTLLPFAANIVGEVQSRRAFLHR